MTKLSLILSVLFLSRCASDGEATRRRGQLPSDSPRAISIAVIDTALAGKSGAFAVLSDKQLVRHLSPTFLQKLSKLREKQAELRQEIGSDQTPSALGYWGLGVLYDGREMFFWWPKVGKPKYIIPTSESINLQAGIASVTVFESNPITDEGKGLGPYSALVVFKYRYMEGIWQLEDADVTVISDRSESFSLIDEVNKRIAKTQNRITELRQFLRSKKIE